LIPEQEESLAIKKCETLNQAIENFFDQKIVQYNFELLKTKLNNTINSCLKKANKKLLLLDEQLEKSRNFEEFRIKGELLTANLYSIKFGDSQTTVLNYYDNTQITIKLDVKKSPSQNAQIFYKSYNKKKRTIDSLSLQRPTIKQEIE
jgi:predicted ribosome quality control (RQC) complex YloA/Tae2 family protein